MIKKCPKCGGKVAKASIKQSGLSCHSCGIHLKYNELPKSYIYLLVACITLSITLPILGLGNIVPPIFFGLITLVSTIYYLKNWCLYRIVK